MGRPPKSTAADEVEEYSTNNVFMRVTQPDGLFAKVDVRARIPIPPTEVFDILSDPDNGKYFRNVLRVRSRNVLSEDKNGDQIIDLVQEGKWKFLIFSGTFPVHLRVEQNRKRGTIRFRLAQEGFMKRFEGEWRLSAFDPEEHTLRPNPAQDNPVTLFHKNLLRIMHKPEETFAAFTQNVQPKMIPPPPLDSYVRRISAKVTKDIMEDLQREARRRRDEREAARRDAKEGGQGGGAGGAGSATRAVAAAGPAGSSPSSASSSSSSSSGPAPGASVSSVATPPPPAPLGRTAGVASISAAVLRPMAEAARAGGGQYGVPRLPGASDVVAALSRGLGSVSAAGMRSSGVPAGASHRPTLGATTGSCPPAGSRMRAEHGKVSPSGAAPLVLARRAAGALASAQSQLQGGLVGGWMGQVMALQLGSRSGGLEGLFARW